MARKTKEEAERTYHALLDAAAMLFIRKGVSNTTLNDIASHADMTRGAVYWHFDNKDNVILSLWERNAATAHQEFIKQLQLGEAREPVALFRTTILSITRKVADEPQLARVMSIVMNNVELTEEKTELQLFLQEKKARLQATLCEAFTTLQQRNALKTSIAPALLSQSLMAYLHGLIQAYLEPGRHSLDLRKDGEILLGLYLDAILQ